MKGFNMLDDCSIIVGSMNEDDETDSLLELVDPDGNVLASSNLDPEFVKEVFRLVGVDIDQVDKPFNMWINFAANVNNVGVE